MILSVEGEKRAERLCEIDELNNVERIFASDSVRAIASAKYLAEKNNIKIELDDRINKDNVNDCIKEFERMITDKHNGNIYEFKYEELWDEAKEIYDILKEI